MAQRIWKLKVRGAGWFSCSNHSKTLWFCINDVVQAPEVLKSWGIPQYILNAVHSLI